MNSKMLLNWKSSIWSALFVKSDVTSNLVQVEREYQSIFFCFVFYMFYGL